MEKSLKVVISDRVLYVVILQVPQVVVCTIRLLCAKKGGEPLSAASPFVGSYLCRLSTETKLLNDSSVSLNINLLEIIKDTTSLTYKLQE